MTVIGFTCNFFSTSTLRTGESSMHTRARPFVFQLFDISRIEKQTDKRKKSEIFIERNFALVLIFCFPSSHIASYRIESTKDNKCFEDI